MGGGSRALRAGDADAAAEGDARSRAPQGRHLADLFRGLGHDLDMDPAYARALESGKREKKRFLINPFSWKMQLWDALLVIGLVYTSLVTPFDAAFLPLQSGSPVFVTNLVVDVIFLLDIFVNFSLPYADAITGLWIRDRWKIANRYRKSWLLLDILSVFPVDWIVMAAFEGDETDGQALRAIRLLKLFKVVRIMRGNRIYKRWRDRIGFNLTFLATMFYILLTVLVAHWMACILGAIPFIEGTTNNTPGGAFNWQSEYFGGVLGLDPDNLDTWTLYIGSLYWSVMTLTTIGFGDVSPKTDVERGFLTFLMFFGASLQAFLIGTVCGLVAELSDRNTQFRNTMNSLNEFMRVYEFPNTLRSRLRSYFSYYHSVKDSRNYQGIIDMLSPALQGEVSLIVNSIWIQQVPFVKLAPQHEIEKFVLALSKALLVEIYAPHENIRRIGDTVDKLYIVSKGLILLHRDSEVSQNGAKEIHVGNMHLRSSVSQYVRQELKHGQCFGHELIFLGVRSVYNCTTLQFSELHVLSKESLEQVLERFPDTQQVLKEYSNRQRGEFQHFQHISEPESPDED